MIKTPFASPANTLDLKISGSMSAAMALTFAILLSLPRRPEHPVQGLLQSRGHLVAGLVFFLAQVLLAVAGCRAVRRTIAAVGDGARARIQAHAFRAAGYAALGAGFLDAPFRYDFQAAIVTDAAGGLLLGYAALIAFTALTPRAVRDRLEGEADRRIAAIR